MADFGMMLLSDRVEYFTDAMHRIGLSTSEVSRCIIGVSCDAINFSVDLNYTYLKMVAPTEEADDARLCRAYFNKVYFSPGQVYIYRMPKSVITAGIDTFSESLAKFIAEYNQDAMYDWWFEFLSKEFDPDCNTYIVTKDDIHSDPLGFLNYNTKVLDLAASLFHNTVDYDSIELGELYSALIRAYAKNCIA